MIAKIMQGGLETTPEGVQSNLPVYRAKNKGKTIVIIAIFVGPMNITPEDARRDIGKRQGTTSEGQEVVYDTTKESHLCASCGKNNVL